jgi:transposase InsO family protein
VSRKGNRWDNACAETLFKTLKREPETLDGKHAAAEARRSVFMYVEAYYNRVSIRRLTIWRLMCLTQGKSLNGVCLMG